MRSLPYTNQLLILLLLVIFVPDLSSQALTKNGSITVTGSDFINKNGATGSTQMLTRTGRVLNATAPVVSTNSISSVTGTSAYSGGNVTSDGGAVVTERGVCWNTSASPTILNSKSSNGSGSGSYGSSLTGLASNTTYYVRAFATNAVGTSYGSELSFTTLTMASLTTTAVSGITITSATSGGNITSDGGSPVTARGICWSTSVNPTILSNVTSNGTGTGTFTSSMTGLQPGTTYYVRAYATTGIGTAYGNQVSFTTTALAIGDTYQGGKIAYIYKPGDPGYVAGQTHGIIAAPSDQTPGWVLGATWYNGSYISTGAGATGLGTGGSNTNTIVSRQGAGDYVAKICYDLVLNGYSDWYLPSRDEAYKLWLSKALIGGFIDLYWTSSEAGTNNACVQDFIFGAQVQYPKSELCRARAIRYF